MKFAANLSTMFQEHAFLDRFEAASRAGFAAVEYLLPYEYDVQILSAALEKHNLEQVLFNAPPGDWAKGERGLAVLLGRDAEFAAGVAKALEYAVGLSCSRIHVMAGLGEVSASAERRYVERIQFAAEEAARVGCQITIEAINPRDMPGYFLQSVHQAVRLLDQIDRANVGLQLDIYHAQIAHGDITKLIDSYIDRVSHVQIASVPERAEPDCGELSYSYVLNRLHEAGYTGWIGCEYFPRSETVGGLSWLHNLTNA